MTERSKIVPSDYMGSTLALRRDGTDRPFVAQVVIPFATMEFEGEQREVTVVKPILGEGVPEIVIPFNCFLKGGKGNGYTVIEGAEVDASVRYAPVSELEDIKTRRYSLRERWLR